MSPERVRDLAARLPTLVETGLEVDDEDTLCDALEVAEQLVSALEERVRAVVERDLAELVSAA